MKRQEILDLLNNRDLRDIHPNKPPKKAASLIVWRGEKTNPHILMGKRASTLKFMPGKYVFPGGAHERADSLLKPAKPLKNRELRLLGPSGQGLAMAALRECFEETGIRLAHKKHAPSKSKIWREYTSIGVRPDLSRLHFLARAITPPNRIKRFDTYFFSTQASDETKYIDLSQHSNTEILSLQWVKLHDAHKLDVAPMTRAILEEARFSLKRPSSPPPVFQVVGGKFICRDMR